MPRLSARRALLNVLGEFTLDGAVPDPSTSALVRVLGEVGVGHHAARQAVRRCGQAGWIDGVKAGREARWTLTDAGRALVIDGIQRVEALGDEVQTWDGTWLVVYSTIPQDRRSVRDALHRALRWNGFGSPMPGVWVSAHHGRRAAVDAAVVRCGLQHSTLVVAGTPSGPGLDERALLERSWDLLDLARRYDVLVSRFSVLAPESPEQALPALLALNEDLQAIPSWDPQLPVALVPGWPGRRDAAALLELRRRWLGPATTRWLQLQT